MFHVVTSSAVLTRFFVEQVGVAVHHQDLLGNTLLSSLNASSDQSALVLAYLLSKGADINCVNERGESLVLAAVLGNSYVTRHTVKLVRLLLAHGAATTQAVDYGLGLTGTDVAHWLTEHDTFE